MPAFDQSARGPISSDEQHSERSADTPSTAALAAQRDMLTRSPRVQAQLQLQQAMDGSPRVVAQAKFADAINNRVVQRNSDSEDEEMPESSDDDEVDYKELLASSTPEKPLSPEEIAEAEAYLKEHRRELGRDDRLELDVLLRNAQSDAAGKKRRETGKRSTKTRATEEEKAKRRNLKTFDADSGSELSDRERDYDTRWKRARRTMAPLLGRSHVPTLTDKDSLKKFATGLPPADTYLGLFSGGSMIPRRVNDKPNRKARRKRMGEVENRFAKRLDDAKPDELKKVLRDEVRPHIESVLFGSSIRPTKEDLDATKTARAARATISEERLKAEKSSAVGVLARPPIERGLTATRGTETHAEQSLLDTELWTTLFGKLVEAIKTNKEEPEKIDSSKTSVDLVLNRSTCIGCARALMLELIRFWESIGAASGIKDWRKAKLAYEDYVDFTVTFPAIYEVSKEKKKGYRNLQRIIAGLQDAGWRVRINTGISGSEKSDEANDEAKKLIAAYSSVPRFYAEGWSQDTARFPIPDELKDAVGKSGKVVINGLLYQKVPLEDSLALDVDEIDDSISAKDAAKFHFQRTGESQQKKSGESGKDETPKSDVAKAYAAIGKGVKEDDVDGELQRMINEENYSIKNVSGSGMNCLIRAIFKAAGVQFDEAMVSIVRRYLIDLGVAVNGDMLDLLGVEGDSLIHFMQAQGVLRAGTGITVHFPGNSMQVVGGANQIHLWYSNAHFKAITK